MLQIYCHCTNACYRLWVNACLWQCRVGQGRIGEIDISKNRFEVEFSLCVPGVVCVWCVCVGVCMWLCVCVCCA